MRFNFPVHLGGLIINASVKKIKFDFKAAPRQLGTTDEGYLYIAQDTGGILKVKDLRKR